MKANSLSYSGHETSILELTSYPYTGSYRKLRVRPHVETEEKGTAYAYNNNNNNKQWR